MTADVEPVALSMLSACVFGGGNGWGKRIVEALNGLGATTCIQPAAVYGFEVSRESKAIVFRPLGQKDPSKAGSPAQGCRESDSHRSARTMQAISLSQSAQPAAIYGFEVSRESKAMFWGRPWPVTVPFGREPKADGRSTRLVGKKGPVCAFQARRPDPGKTTRAPPCCLPNPAARPW